MKVEKPTAQVSAAGACWRLVYCFPWIHIYLYLNCSFFVILIMKSALMLTVRDRDYSDCNTATVV